MATDLMFPFKDKYSGWAMLLLCALAHATSAAELSDPTRPPTELGSEVKGITSSLQSIIISPTRRAAIINGQTVELGAKLGDVRLIEVNGGSVVLEGVQGRRVLTLFPSIKTNKETMPLPMKNDAKRPSVRLRTGSSMKPGTGYAPDGESIDRPDDHPEKGDEK